MTISDTACDFFEACETSKGWGGCKEWCHDDATFSCQTDALVNVETLASYADWMQSLLGPISDGHYELKAFACDEAHGSVMAAAVFHGTHTGDGGPVPATGKSVAADYVYQMDFDSEKIHHATKIWNDGYSLRAHGYI